jgi:hypothetical protein
VDNTVFTQINGDVVDAGSIAGEEKQISLPEIVAIHRDRLTDFRDLPRGSR